MLVARHGTRQRPNFAHYQRQEDASCYETAVHRMAKQILMSAQEVLLPAWSRTAELCDIQNQPHATSYERAPRRWPYSQCREEVWMQGARPDLLLHGQNADQPPLLVEIRVTHAVGEQKAALVRQRGWAMVEIDLSKLAPELVLGAGFKAAVLDEAGNREWIHSPGVERIWSRHLQDLEARVANENARILEERAELARRRERNKQVHDAQRRELAAYRERKRRAFLMDLEALNELTAKDCEQAKLERLATRDRHAIATATERSFGTGPVPDVLSHVPKGWQLVDAHPARWQLSIWSTFIQGKPPGTIIDTKRWVPHLGTSIGFDLRLKRLFDAQQRDTESARALGSKRYGRYRAWFFDEQENKLIPSPFELVGDLARRLEGSGVLRATGRPFIFAVVNSELAKAPETADVPPVGSQESAAAPMDGRAMMDEERQEMLTICPICSASTPAWKPSCSGCGTGLRRRSRDPSVDLE